MCSFAPALFQLGCLVNGYLTFHSLCADSDNQTMNPLNACLVGYPVLDSSPEHSDEVMQEPHARFIAIALGNDHTDTVAIGIRRSVHK